MALETFTAEPASPRGGGSACKGGGGFADTVWKKNVEIAMKKLGGLGRFFGVRVFTRPIVRFRYASNATSR